jgi:hypothetical protein
LRVAPLEPATDHSTLLLNVGSCQASVDLSNTSRSEPCTIDIYRRCIGLCFQLSNRSSSISPCCHPHPARLDLANSPGTDCIANLALLNYNTSRASDLPTTLSPSDQDFCPRAHYFSPGSEGRPRQNLPPRSCPCLLLKPISAPYAHCPICSPYRPTRASVLSGYIDSVSVAAIIYHAPRL